MLVIWGCLLAAVGIVMNEWTVSRFVFPGEELSDTAKLTVRVAEACLLSWGILSILLRKRSLVKKLNLALFSILVAAPVLGEIALRMSFRMDEFPTKNADLYADQYGEDDYWKLRMRWNEKWKPWGSDMIHPLLGWSQAKISKENPFGLSAATRKQMAADGRKKVLFYGDSFVAGSAKKPIPTCMQEKLESADAVHLGVGGYGTDQIYLMFRETWRLATARPFVLFGVMTKDIDRCVLTVRTARKPRLSRGSDGSVSVGAVPIPGDQAFLAEEPMEFPSFLWRLLINKVRPPASRRHDPWKTEKEDINRGIFDAVKSILQTDELDLAFVIFYPKASLREPDWRESFLKQELDRRAIPYIDTKPVLLDHCQREKVSIDSLYHPTDGHHNDLGNTVIADAILKHVKTAGVQ